MDLIEGISNEVLVAFLVTSLLTILAVFYTLFTDRTGAPLLRPSVHQATENSVDENRSETTRDNFTANQRETNASDSSTTSGRREGTCINDPTQASDAADGVQPSGGPGGDGFRRRDVGGADTGQPSGRQSEHGGEGVRRRDVGGTDMGQSSADETMVIKVKHNENIQTFNVSRNITVIELKRLAFSADVNAGRRVRFVYAGQLLQNDNDALTKYGLLHNTVVHCVITDPPAEQTATTDTGNQEEDLDISRLLIPLLTAALIMAWYGLASYGHIFTGSSIAILMFLTSLYIILVYVTTVQ